jgi:mannose-1-phosphate guanylyltransferase
MNDHVQVLPRDRRLDTQIKAAVRVAHLMITSEQQSDADLLMLITASRQVEDSEDMHQAMAFAVCAAQKNKHAA